MQFSVILEGACEEYSASTEDSKSEVERFLHSVKVSPQLLTKLTSNNAITLKNGLKYDEAIKICDRLGEFGLDCFIDPPTKPEENEEPVLASTANVHNMADSAHKARKEQPSKPKENSKPARSNVTPLRRPEPIRKKLEGKKPAKQPDLATALRQIKTLFQLPKEGAIKHSTSQSKRFAALSHTITLMSICLGYPILIAGLTVMSAFGVYSLFTLVSQFSILFAIISAGVLSCCAGAIIFILLTPLWSRQAAPVESIFLKEDEEAKFFALVTICCKILGITPPASINLVLPPNPNFSYAMRCETESPREQLLRIGSKHDTGYTLSINALHIRFFSAREFCGYLAATCARYSVPALRYNCILEQYATNLLFEFSRNTSVSSHSLSKLAQNTPSISTAATRLGQLVSGIESFPRAYSKLTTNILRKKLAEPPRFTKEFQACVEGSKKQQLTTQTLENADIFYRLALEELLENNSSNEFINDIPEFARLLLKESSTETTSTQEMSAVEATNSIIVKDFPIRNLLVGRSKYSAQLTAELLYQNGIKIKKENLITIKSFRANLEKQRKLKALSDEYFSHWFSTQQFWRLPSIDSFKNLHSDAVMKQLDHCIERIRFASPDRNNHVETHHKQVQQIAELQASNKLKQSGIELATKTTHIAGTEQEKYLKKVLFDFKELTTELGQQNALMGERLALGLLLDVQRHATTQKLHQSLREIGEYGNKVTQLRTYLIEFSLLLRNQPKKYSQHHQLQTKELSNKVSEGSKNLLRTLKHCPFDMCDPRYLTLAHFAENKLSLVNTNNADERILERGKAIVNALEQGYEQMSYVAAAYASRMEKLCGVQSIRKAVMTK
ncbi:hypothetical protein [Aurantivibrio plasticivorans]